MREQVTEFEDLVGRTVEAVTYNLADESFIITLTPSHFCVFTAAYDEHEEGPFLFLNLELPELSSTWVMADICTEEEFKVLDALNMLDHKLQYKARLRRAHDLYEKFFGRPK